MVVVEAESAAQVVESGTHATDNRGDFGGQVIGAQTTKRTAEVYDGAKQTEDRQDAGSKSRKAVARVDFFGIAFRQVFQILAKANRGVAFFNVVDGRHQAAKHHARLERFGGSHHIKVDGFRRSILVLYRCALAAIDNAWPALRGDFAERITANRSWPKEESHDRILVACSVV